MAIAFGKGFEGFAHLVFWQAIYVLLALLYNKACSIITEPWERSAFWPAPR